MNPDLGKFAGMYVKVVSVPNICSMAMDQLKIGTLEVCDALHTIKTIACVGSIAYSYKSS